MPGVPEIILPAAPAGGGRTLKAAEKLFHGEPAEILGLDPDREGLGLQLGKR